MSSINEVGLRLAWENSRHIATPPLVSSRNDQTYYSQKSSLEIGVKNQWKSKNIPRYGSDNEIYTLNIKFQAVQVNVPLFLVKSSKYYIPYSNKINWSCSLVPQNILSTYVCHFMFYAQTWLLTKLYMYSDVFCIECFHMTSRRPYWCPKTMKRRPCWCPKPILWELNSLLMQTLSFVPINLHRFWSRE